MRLAALSSTFQIFGESDLDDALRNRISELKSVILQMDRNRVLSSNEADLIDYCISQFTYEPLQIEFDSVTMSECESTRQMIDFGDLIVQRGLMYSFHLPVSGDLGLLRTIPNPRIMWTQEFKFDGESEISFDVFGTPGDIAAVVAEKDRMFGHVKGQMTNINNQVRAHNTTVERETEVWLKTRKAEVLAQMETAAAIGVPMKKRDDVPRTFSAPQIKRKPRIVELPKSPNEKFKPEPTLDESTFQEIVKLIHEFGVEFERHPALFEGKDEEALRDHFILILSPHFDGGVTGETFNKAGKTDILIRYKSSNVFVAECKFWHGKKAYADAIDQALGYLTWRDSKAAIICFVDNLQFQPVLDAIVDETPKHLCYKATLSETDARYEYRFHLIDDPSRNVLLTVLCFHLPKKRHKTK